MKELKLIQLVLVCFTLFALFSSINSDKRQVIWYKDMNYGYRHDAYNFFYNLGSKFYESVDTDQNDSESENMNDFVHDAANDDFLIRVSRTEGQPYNQNTLESEPDHHHLRYFLPEIDGSHKAGLANVVWDIKVNCGCYVTYKIKYFRCNVEAQKYFDNLTNTDKIIRYKEYENANSIRPVDSAIRPPPKGQFSTKQELVDSLYNVLPCVREIGPDSDSCCLPYPCWNDMTSIQCICALDKTNNGNTDVYGDDCLCGIDSTSQLCTNAKSPTS